MKLLLSFLFFFFASVLGAQISEVKLTTEEISMVARLVIGEAEGESFEGKKMVAETILNRLVKGGFGTSIKGIIEHPKQYDARWNESLWAREPKEEDLKAVREALDNPGLPIDVVFYVNLKSLPKGNSWRERLESLGHFKTEGAHSFYYGFEGQNGTMRAKKVTLPKEMREINVPRDNTNVQTILGVHKQ
jgi:spore germination cell wall hydrolase CwlJ-like protein